VMIPVLAIWFVVLLGLFGLARMNSARKGVDQDWQTLASFGHALQAYQLSRGHDGEAYARIVALAPVLAAQTKTFTRSATDPFENIEELPRAFDENAGASRAALETLRGRVLGYESTLQSEMKLLARTSASPWAWLESGARGLVLLPYGLTFAGTVERRARRRDLEADPRIRQAATLVLGVVIGASLFVLGRAGLAVARAFLDRVNGR